MSDVLTDVSERENRWDFSICSPQEENLLYRSAFGRTHTHRAVLDKREA